MTSVAPNDDVRPHSFVRVSGLKPVMLPQHFAVKR